MTIKFKKVFDKKIDKYGQSAILHKTIQGERCPCYDEQTGFCDPQWHRDNPEAPECNEEGYINAGEDLISLKAFIFPANSVDRKFVDEIVLASIGQLTKDDYVYIGKSDIDIFNLQETDWVEFDNRKWQLASPDNYKIGDVNIAFVAKLKLLGDV